MPAELWSTESAVMESDVGRAGEESDPTEPDDRLLLLLDRRSCSAPTRADGPATGWDVLDLVRGRSAEDDEVVESRLEARGMGSERAAALTWIGGPGAAGPVVGSGSGWTCSKVG